MKKLWYVLILGLIAQNCPLNANPDAAASLHTSVARIAGMLAGGLAGGVTGCYSLLSYDVLPKAMEITLRAGGATFAGAVLGSGLMISPVQDQNIVLLGAFAGSVLSHAWLEYLMKDAGSGGLAYFVYEPVFTPLITTAAACGASLLAQAYFSGN